MLAAHLPILSLAECLGIAVDEVKIVKIIPMSSLCCDMILHCEDGGYGVSGVHVLMIACGWVRHFSECLQLVRCAIKLEQQQQNIHKTFTHRTGQRTSPGVYRECLVHHRMPILSVAK